MSSACKFCGCTDKHINRDNLCGPCATLLDKVKYQPDKLSTEQFDEFLRRCKLNHAHGRFVPVAQRKLFKVKWHCKRCGSLRKIDQDHNYINYCIACAEYIRTNREMPPRAVRKTRSDKKRTSI